MGGKVVSKNIYSGQTNWRVARWATKVVNKHVVAKPIGGWQSKQNVVVIGGWQGGEQQRLVARRVLFNRWVAQ